MSDDKVTVKCSACGKHFKAPAALIGKKARCACGRVITVPMALSAEDLAQKWYYSEGGKQVGPVPLSELRGMCERKQVQPTEYVWSKCLEAWQAASEVPHLADIFAAEEAPPEAPPPAPAQEEQEGEPEEEEGEPPGTTQIGIAAVGGPAKKSAPAKAAAPAAVPQKVPAKAKTEIVQRPAAAPAAPPKAEPPRPAPAKPAPVKAEAPRKEEPAARPAVARAQAVSHTTPAPIVVPAYKFARVLSTVLLAVGGLSIAGAAAWLGIAVAEGKEVGEWYLQDMGLVMAGFMFFALSQVVSLLRSIAQAIWSLGEPVDEL